MRPTVENRDRMPVPDARARRRAARPQRPESGLRGRDAAWADSARLETRRPVDTSSRPTRRPANTGSTGRQASGNTGIGLGGTPGGTRFDQDFEYAFYQRQMIARIPGQLAADPGARPGHRRHPVHDLPRRGHQRRGGGNFERPVAPRPAALRAVVLAEPLPRLPDSYPRDRVGVHLLFTYEQEATGSPDGPAPEVS